MIQRCELSNLAELATEAEHVRCTVVACLDDLLSLGVSGFRIDAVEHIDPDDVAAIVAALPDASAPSCATVTEFAAATAVMLASDCGPPTLYSGCAFSDRDEGPVLAPDGSVADASCTGDERPEVVAESGWADGAWVCQHRWPGTLELDSWRP